MSPMTGKIVVFFLNDSAVEHKNLKLASKFIREIRRGEVLKEDSGFFFSTSMHPFLKTYFVIYG
jgi:hypothetical protein